MPAEPRERAPPAAAVTVRSSCAADCDSVRANLAAVMAGLDRLGIPPDLRDRAELVLAEVMNNIVEHAYAGQPGQIDLAITLVADGLCCRVSDGGRPMPQGAPPAARLPALRADDLPEGGFGWFLIRQLSENLRYRRRDGANELSFRVPLSPAATQSCAE